MSQEPAKSTTNDNPQFEDDYGASQPRQGFGRFLRDVIIILALGAGAVYFYNQNVHTKKAIGELTMKARDRAKKHNLKSLEEAEKLYKEILDLDASHAQTQAALAGVYYSMHQHGLPSKDKAQQYLQQANADDAQSPVRFAVDAYLKTESGDAAGAEKLIRGLLDKGFGAPIMAHALGVSLSEQGKYIESNRVIRSAQEADFSAAAYRITLADNAHRQNNHRAAIKHLDGIVRKNANPEHNLAKAQLAAIRAKTYGSLLTPANLLKEIKESKLKMGPRAEAMVAWTEGELALAVGNTKQAEEKADAAIAKLKNYAPFHGLKARIQKASGKTKEAIATYEAAIAMKPLYEGLKWDLAKLKSEMKDDGALALVDELDKSYQGSAKGPEFEIFRGKHALKKGDVDAAKEHFTKAADLGDNPEILLGLAKVAFAEESKKDNKADLERVGTALSQALDARKYFPEAQELLGEVSMWNYLIPAADAAFSKAEGDMKKLKRPIPEVLGFYDRVAANFEGLKAKDRRVKKAAKKMGKKWRAAKQAYIASLLTK